MKVQYVEVTGQPAIDVSFVYNEALLPLMRALAEKYKIGRRAWIAENKVWRFAIEALPELRAGLKNYPFRFDPKLEEIHNAAIMQMQNGIEKSRIVDTDLDVPRPAGLNFFPFQRAGIARALEIFQNGLGVLLSDEMGAGKSVETAGILNLLPVKNILIVSPKSVLINWKLELEKWLIEKRSIGIADTKQVPDTEVVIANYDAISRSVVFKTEKNRNGKLVKKIDHFGPFNRDWDMIVVDESHKCKSQTALRTKAVLGLAERTRYKLFLTGTPIPNRLGEIWTSISTLDPKRWNNYWAFTGKFKVRYNNGYGWAFDGRLDPKDPEDALLLKEIQDKLRATIMIRRLKSEVMSELPPKTRQVIVLEAETPEAQEAVQQTLNLWNKNENAESELKTQIELAKIENEDSYKVAVKALRSAKTKHEESLFKLRHTEALAKIPQVIEHVEDLLESGKVLLFAHHLDVIDALWQAFKDRAVVLTGATSTEDRQKAVEQFQNDPKIDVFIGGIMAAGEGITLTEAKFVVFAELSWVPKDLEQCENRPHRPGLKHNLLIQHLVFNDSVDAIMAKRIIQKQEMIDAVLDKEPMAAELEEPPEEPIATKEVSRDHLDAKAAALSFAQIASVLAGLKVLRGLCDGAASRDNAGFSKADFRLGFDLAARETLSPKQAALGWFMLEKYRRQLPEGIIKNLEIGETK